MSKKKEKKELPIEETPEEVLGEKVIRFAMVQVAN